MRRLRAKWKEDKGAAIVFVAGSLVLLMGLAAMGTDLAWFYLNTARVQRAADAAALGGVIWLPNEPGTANATAFSIAAQNGYSDGVDNAVVTPAPVPGEPNQLEVTIEDTVPTFFLKVLGFNTMDITRSAIAEYIPPLKLGSPSNQFGNACDPEYEGDPGFPADCGDNFWANIHGWFTHTSFGDAYAGHCQGGNNDDEGCPANSIARDSGYLYGIESSSGFTVQFVDLAFHNISGGVGTDDHHRTGDRGCEDWGSSSASCGPTMIVNLYAPDPTPLDLSDNGAPVCTATVPPQPQIQEQVGGNGVPYSWQTPSGAGCWSQSGPGIWVVQVMHQYPGATDDRAGLNRYSIRSTSGQLFALGDFSIYNNATGSTTSFYLAEVPDFYAGKTFVVEMFDPGEFSGAGTGFIQVIGADGTVWNDGECRLYNRPTGVPDGPWSQFATVGAGSNCQEATTAGEYNNRWLKFEMDLPTTYTCNQAAGACWWKINYVYPGGASVQDTTTWRAFMIGNPIHLVGP